MQMDKQADGIADICLHALSHGKNHCIPLKLWKLTYFVI